MSFSQLENALLRDSKQLLGVRHKNICSLIGQINDDKGDIMAVFPWLDSKLGKTFHKYKFRREFETLSTEMSATNAYFKTKCKIFNLNFRSNKHCATSG